MNLRMRWTFFGVDVSNNPKMLILMGNLMVGCSLLWLIICGVFTFVNLAFLPGALSANGTIISCQFDKGMCSPTVRFVTQSGQEITFVSSTSSSSYAVGDTLSVKYHPGSPHDARIDATWILWLLPLMGCVGFLIFFFVGRFTLKRGHMLRAEEQRE